MHDERGGSRTTSKSSARHPFPFGDPRRSFWFPFDGNTNFRGDALRFLRLFRERQSENASAATSHSQGRWLRCGGGSGGEGSSRRAGEGRDVRGHRQRTLPRPRRTSMASPRDEICGGSGSDSRSGRTRGARAPELALATATDDSSSLEYVAARDLVTPCWKTLSLLQALAFRPGGIRLISQHRSAITK